MYHHHFGLNEEPFSIAVNPRYLFMSARHRDALAHLLYGVGAGGGFILLTGEVGTGKTTINRCLLEQLPENTDLAIVLNPALNAIELLATVCDELGISYPAGEQSLKVLTDKLHQFLLTNHANGRNTVLLIDEAQHLRFEVLEQIRLLTNLETNTKKLLQIILVGQPELRNLLNKPELRQLAQRITARYQLKPLNLQETQAYINHRLQVAGLSGKQRVFPVAVIKGIHKASRGVPRIINVLCDRMLLGCYGQHKTIVDRAMLKQAIIEVMGEEEEAIQKPQSLALPYAALALVIIVALVMWKWPLFDSFINDKSVVVNNSAPPALTPEEKNISPAVQQPSPVEPEPSPPWLSYREEAFQELAFELGLDSIDCLNTKSTVRCETMTVQTWQDLQVYNRPAVLTLISPAKIKRYAALISLSDQQATLLINKQRQVINLENFGEQWTGEFIFLWRPSVHYNGPLTVGDRGPMIKWLASQFAQLDNQTRLLATDTFNSQLQQRVKIFQQDNQLEADGVVGLKTLLALNEQLGNATTLNNTIETTSILSAEEG
jgi:general secretion pathway protein A